MRKNITIGNFYDDNNTNTQANPSASGSVGTYGAFYFVDDVRVEKLGNVDVVVPEINQIQVYPTHIENVVNIVYLKIRV